MKERKNNEKEKERYSYVNIEKLGRPMVSNMIKTLQQKIEEEEERLKSSRMKDKAKRESEKRKK